MLTRQRDPGGKGPLSRGHADRRHHKLASGRITGFRPGLRGKRLLPGDKIDGITVVLARDEACRPQPGWPGPPGASAAGAGAGEVRVTELTDHEQQVSPRLASRHAAAARLRHDYAAIPRGSSVRLAKSTSNLFRFRDSQPSGLVTLDVSNFSGVLHIDKAKRTAIVGGMTTYEDLADATLRHGLMPLVVPQLKTITLGGAVCGLGIESTSLRNGLPHESVLEMEILTGDGRLVTAAPESEHASLYWGFPNSYGTLGYALWLTISLEPVSPYVHLRHFRFGDPAQVMTAIGQIAQDGSYQGHRADFVDGTAFGPDELYLTVGAYIEVAPWLSDYTGQQIYYQSIRGPAEDFLTVRDYFSRWGNAWVWCSPPLRGPRPAVRPPWPRPGPRPRGCPQPVAPPPRARAARAAPTLPRA